MPSPKYQHRFSLYINAFFLNRIFFVSFLIFSVASCSPAVSIGGLNLKNIKLPPGFSITIYADKVPGARSMAMSPNGTLFVGTRNEGKVYAVLSLPGDGRARTVVTILENLQMPNGVAVHNGALYVAEVSRILRYDDIENHIRNMPSPVIVRDDFPKETHHGWKYINFGPDGFLYVPVGAPCNVCERDDPRFAAIMRMTPDGGNLEIFSVGVRNTVGFDWHPESKILWFTDNGRDWMGNELPPDELNRAPEAGMHFGFPYCHGNNIPDPSYGLKRTCGEFVPPAKELGPHVAALGMKFYTGSMFPEKFRNQIFIAEHGSWNRTDPIGYRLMVVRLEGEKATAYETFAEGWLQGMTAWGRPVDVLVAHDGALLVSDDRAGVIYRIIYQT